MEAKRAKKLSKTISLWKGSFILLALMTMVLFPVLGEAGKATPRPLSDFLDNQGTTSSFFPPVPDYVGWANNPQVIFALVDYAGLANEYIKGVTGYSLGTKMKGSIIERELPDGKAKISLVLNTSKALGFAQSVAALEANNWDFLATPTIFGNKAQDVVEGADAAVGPVTLKATFTISAPGAPLPDFLAVLFNSAEYAPVKFSFKSITKGKKAHLIVWQTGATNEEGALIFSKEKVVIRSK